MDELNTFSCGPQIFSPKLESATTGTEPGLHQEGTWTGCGGLAASGTWVTREIRKGGPKGKSSGRL